MDKWTEELQKAFKTSYSDNGYITISVTSQNFTSEAKKYELVKHAIVNGRIHSRIAKMRKSNHVLFCYELMYCVEEGDHGDAEGYGVEPDVWIKAYIDLDGNFMTPFCLWEEPKYEEYFEEIMKRMNSGD